MVMMMVVIMMVVVMMVVMVVMVVMMMVVMMMVVMVVQFNYMKKCHDLSNLPANVKTALERDSRIRHFPRCGELPPEERPRNPSIAGDEQRGQRRGGRRPSCSGATEMGSRARRC